MSMPEAIVARFPQLKQTHDVFAHTSSGGRGESHDRCLRQMLTQRGELAIFRTEIVAPFADAMRLVDCEQIDRPRLQTVEKAREHQPFGSDIEQMKLAVVQTAKSGARFGFAKG